MANSPIKVRAYGKILNFPAGTSPEAIEQALAEHEPLLNPDYKPPEPEALDYAKGFAVGANKLVSGVGFLAEAAGAKDTGKTIREFGDRGAKYWNDKMSKGGQLASKSQVFVDDDNEDSITGIKLSDDWGKSLLMSASQSLPSMFAAAIPGVAVTKGIQALAKLGLAGGSGATIPLLAGTAAPVGVASNIIARVPSAIGFGASEGVVAGAMNASEFKASIEGMTDEELSKSPVYRALKTEHDPETARSMLAEQAALDLFGKTAVSTGAIGAVTGGGALSQAYQKVTSGAKTGLLGTVIKGAGSEALQEGPQSGGEQYIQNLTTKNFLDPTKDTTEGVATAAASGAAVGGFMGGVVGGGSSINITPDRRAQVLNEKRRLAEMKASTVNARQQERDMADIGAAQDVDQVIAAASKAASKSVVHADDILRTEDPTLADIEKLTGLKPTEAIDTAIDEINTPQEELKNGNDQTTQQKATTKTPVLEQDGSEPWAKDVSIASLQSGKSSASWVVRDKKSGEVLFETFDKAKVDALNTDKYEAVPAYKYLTELNSRIGGGPGATKTPVKPLANKSPVLNAETFKASNPSGVDYAKYLKEHPNREQAAKVDAQNVENNLIKGLQRTGKFTAKDSKTYAKPFSEFFRVNAERQGILPSELYERMPLKFSGKKGADGLTQNSLEFPEGVPLGGDAENNAAIMKDMTARGVGLDLGDTSSGLSMVPTGSAKDSPLSEKGFRDTPLKQGEKITTVKVNGKDRPAVNSEGKPIPNPEKFHEWFGDSKVVDKEGRPLTVYHGTDLDFSEFNRAKIGDKFPNFSIGFHFSTEPDEAGIYAGSSTRASNPNIVPVYLRTSNPLLIKTKDNASKYIDANRHDIARQIMDSRGSANEFDSVIVEDPDGAKNIVVFNPTQIKSAVGNNGEFNPSDPNILKQSKKVPEGSLVAQHNITMRGILHADRMGGLAVPSLAVADKDKPLTGFGEITLIASSNMVDPKRGAKVFGADIYSPRYPSVTLVFDRKSVDRLNEKLKPFTEAVNSNPIGFYELNNAGSSREVARIFKQEPAVLAAFLTEKGIAPKYKEKPKVAIAKELKPFTGATDAQALVANPNFLKAVGRLHKEFLDEKNNGDFTQSDKDRFLRNLAYDDAHRVVAYSKYIEGKGKIDPNASSASMRLQIDAKKLTDELEVYAEGMISQMRPEEKLFKGFTYSGSRRYSAHTLENVVNELKKNLRGGETFNYGLGTVRSKYTPQFKSLDQIRKEKGRLVSDEEFNSIRKEVDDKFFKLGEKLDQYHEAARFDTFAQAAYDSATMGVPRALKENGYKDVPPELMEEVRDFLADLAHMPTEYFEVKLSRIVDLSEFSAAVVPKHTPQSILDVLKKNGITDIKKYKDAGDRKKQIGSFEDLLFQSNFYSALEKEISNLKKIANKDGLVSVEQAKAWINSRQKEGKFKQAEVEAVGLIDWLDTLEGKVPVADVENFVQENGVQVEEVVLEGSSEPDFDEDRVFDIARKKFNESYESNGDEIDAALAEVADEMFDDHGDSRWESLVGLSDAEEVEAFLKDEEISTQRNLVHLFQSRYAPEDVLGEDTYYQILDDAAEQAWEQDQDYYLDQAREELTNEAGGGSGGTEFEKYVLRDGEVDYKELLFTLPNSKVKFNAPHFGRAQDNGAENIFAHTRINERYVDAPMTEAELAQKAAYDEWVKGNKSPEILELLDEKREAARDYEVAVGKWKERMIKDTSISDKEFEQAIYTLGSNPPEELKPFIKRVEEVGAKVKAKQEERLAVKPPEPVKSSNKERVLFVEEIQSDWAQKGRDEGFAKTTKMWHIAYKNGPNVGSAYFTENEAREALEDSFPGRETEFELRPGNKTIGIPSAPFVTDTKAWTGLVAKRLLRYAAENGFDRIAWTAGAQQAERYRLSKFVDNVTATRRDNGGYSIQAFEESGKRILSSTYEAEELAGVIGKELAEKIINQPDGIQTYTGLDLDVGGSGMREFYDRIVPSVFNDVSRKLGGGKVETISMGTQSGKVIKGLEGRILIAYPNGSYLKNRNTGAMTESQDRADRFDSYEEASKFLDKFESQNLHEVGRQMSLAITPALKEKVMQGLPLFQRDRAGYNPNTFTISLMDGSDMSSVIHEGGHFYLEALADMASQPNAPKQIVDDFDTTLQWFGLGDQVQDSAEPATRAQGYPTEAGEPIATFRKADEIKSHPSYTEAKAGSDQAAFDLVNDLVTENELNKAKERFVNATFVPVSLLDKDGANRIPTALAYHYANATGGSVSDSIFESKKAYHTGMNAMERLVSRANFSGKVEPGRRYVLVDDVTTVGSTLADLASYIQENGGEVIGSVLLANATRSGNMFANAKTLKRLEVQYGNEIRELFKIEPNALTQEEAQYLIGFRNADELRGSAIKAQGSRLARIHARKISKGQSSVDQQRLRDIWQSMTLEQKRPYHEQWAQSFELYAMEGVSPTEEMQPVFERFKQWMLETYKSLKEFLKNNPLAGRLNNEVREVFDRLLASDADIAATAAARGSLNQSGKQQSTQDPTSAAITAARAEMNKEYEEALKEELESIAVTGNGADISLLIASPEYWDPENEELTEAGFAEYDRLNYLLAKERVGAKEVQELSDINSMGQTAQAEAFNAYADAAGLHTNVIYSTGGSRYVEVEVGDSFYKFRFADHFNTVRDSTMTPDFNVAPGRSDFTQAVKFLDDAVKSAKKDVQFNQSGKTKPTTKKGGSTTAAPATPTAPPAAPAKPFNPNEDIPETKFRKAQRLSQDSFNRFTVIKEWLAEHGTVLSEKADVFQAEERYNSLVANQLEDFREQQRNPLIEKISKAGFTLDDVADFLEAQHAEEANKAIQDVRSDPMATAYGITDAEAKAYLAKADPKLAKLANELRDITEQSKQMRLAAGLIGQDEVDAWEAAYEHYIPVKGDADVKGGTGKGLKVNFKSKRRLGHGRRDEAVIENIFLDHERAIMQVEKNRVAKHLVMMAAEMNMPEIVSIGRPVKRNTLRTKTAYEVQVNGVTRSVFSNKQAADMFKQLLPSIDKSVQAGTISINPTSDSRVIAMASPMLAENEINAYIDGHAIRVQINDDLLARAYGKLGVTGFSALVSAGRAFNGYLSKVYTGYNPEFILTNMIRDFTSGLINLSGEEGGKIALKASANYLKSFNSLMKYAISNGKKSDKWIDMYRANGGNTGAAYLSDLERLGDEVKTEYASYQGVLKNLKSGDIANASRAAGRKAFNVTLKWIYNLNQAGENAMRLSAFRAMIESGKTPNQAAKVAKNITVNFNRKGELGAEANAAYLFFNASVQGTAALAHAHFKGKHKAQAWGLSSMVGVLGYLATMALIGDDEDDYDKINDYTKSRNFMIKAGDGYAQVPVPYGYGFFWNTGRAIAEAQHKGELGKLPWHMAASAIEELTPFSDTVVGSQDGFQFDQVLLGMLPTVIKIPAQPAFNRQLFSGGEMFPERASQQFQPDREKMWRSTQGTMYDKLAGWLSDAGLGDVSPETLKHYTRTATGGTGALVDATVSAAMLKKEGAELEPSEIPFFRKAYSKLTIKDQRAAYYKTREEAKKTAEAFSRAKTRNDVTTIDKLIKDEGEMIGLDAYANSLSEAIGAVRDLQDAIRLDEGLNAAEKRVQIKELEITEGKFYDQFLDVFKTEKLKMKERKN